MLVQPQQTAPLDSRVPAHRSDPFICQPVGVHYRSLVRHILRAVAERLSPDQATVMLRNGDTLEVVNALHPQPGLEGSRAEKGRGVAWAVLSGRRPTHIWGVLDGGQETRRPKYSLVVPLLPNGQAAGTLNINRQDRNLTEAELAWGRALALLLGYAIHARHMLLLALAFGTDPEELAFTTRDQIEDPDQTPTELMELITLLTESQTDQPPQVFQRETLTWMADQVVAAALGRT